MLRSCASLFGSISLGDGSPRSQLSCLSSPVLLDSTKSATTTSAAPTATASLSARGRRKNRLRVGSDASTSVDNPSARGCSVVSPLGVSRRVGVSDLELCRRAAKASGRLDFDALTDLSRNRWSWRESLREFTLFTMDADAERRHEVLVAGDVHCSIEEAMGVLHALTSRDYNATMKGLLVKDFIFGSVVHAIAAATGAADGSPSLSASTSSATSSSAATTVSQASPLENYVAVKTSTFVRPRVFGRNEEWCYLESFERSVTGDSFIVSQTTMDASELNTGKAAAHSRVDALRDVSTALYVEKIPRTQRTVRLFFHAKYDGGLESFLDGHGVATPKTARSRLQSLAKGVSRFADVLRRRRLGIQTLANRAAFAAAKNTRCTCCTKRLLAVVTAKKRCYLCAYYVCDKCWRRESMETCNGTTSSILICTRCLECVDACEYSGVLGPRLPASSTLSASSTASVKKPHLIRVEPDDRDTNDSDGSSGDPRGKVLVEILEQSLRDSDELIQAAARSVIQHMLKLESSSSSNSSDRDEKTSSGTTIKIDLDPALVDDDEEPTTGVLGLQSVRDHVDAFETYLSHAPLTPIGECVLANATSRSYPIFVPATPATTVPDYPLPHNEAKRLDVIHTDGLLDLGEVAELNIICSLAAETLECAISMITVIDRDDELILSCNASFLHRTKMPRNQTFCSHLLMDDKPLLIRHPEADVRFHTMDAVVTHGIRFYCGFPISARDGTIVGSVCCLDTEQRTLTQSQYAMMATLARAASKVIRTKSLSTAVRRTSACSPP